MAKLNILIVTDDIYQRQLYNANFTGLGHSVTSCGTGSQALAIVRQRLSTAKRIQAVFLKYGLPDTNGILLGEELIRLDDSLVLMMFPTRQILNEDVKRAFEIFGRFLVYPGFTHKPLDHYGEILQRISAIVHGGDNDNP